MDRRKRNQAIRREQQAEPQYGIKIWCTEYSYQHGTRPEIREGIPYALASALALNAGYAKATVYHMETGIILFEIRNSPNQ